jgi:hypothetical protein
MIFDEDSFLVKTKKRDISALTVINNDVDKKKCIGYGKRAPRDKWTDEETKLFYKVRTCYYS